VSPEAQRIAIAEACGWTYTRATLLEKPLEFWTKPDAPHGYSDGSSPPNYPADLNAMHEAVEARINYTNVLNYHCDLLEVVVRTRQLDASRKWPFSICINATAAQRAEAFLRTLNLWKD
jgi:hypothetical protein